jgi:predicted Zn-dependent peptidase
MKKTGSRFVLWGSVLLLGAGALVAPRLSVSAQQAAKPRGVQVAFKEHKLKNGLRVILSEDRSAPTVSISVNYDVGSRNERQGRTGFAHLFEHMMFQGSKNVGKGEHFILVFNNGGNMNGTTNTDRTIYFETAPSNQLDLLLYLEADRMRALNITKENLDNQRHAVQEERRLRVDNQPYGKTFETISETVYDNFAYKHSVIGSMADLEAATVEDVAEFFKTYYAPNNAVVALVGDFSSADALAKIKKHFEDIPGQPKPPAVDMTEPTQTAERRKSLEDGFARLTRLDIIYKVPPANTPDWYALDVAGAVLLRGQSSRLFQKLVREKQVALGVFGGPSGARGTATFSFVVQLSPRGRAEDVEKMIYEEVERMKTEAVSQAEVDKIRMQYRRTRVQSLQGTLGRAIELAENAVAYNDPGLINTQLEKFAKVTPADIQRVAQTYWKETNRTVIITVPKPQARPGAGSAQ